MAVAAGAFGWRLPSGFLPFEDQGYVFINVQLPAAASLQRTDEVTGKIEAILRDTPGVRHMTTVVGFSLLSTVSTTYNAFFFVTLAPWETRTAPEEQIQAISARVNGELSKLPEAQAFVFPPPAIPGVGTAGGVMFLLEDRAGKDIGFLAEHEQRFIEAVRKQPEIALVNSTFIPSVPQVFAKVDRDKVLKQGVSLSDVYQTLQTFMGGVMVNYFNRFGRVWQVYVQAEGEFRTRAENVGQFYVRNAAGDMVPLSALVDDGAGVRSGVYDAVQRIPFCAARRHPEAGIQLGSGRWRRWSSVFAETMPPDMGFDYMGMSFQEKVAAQGVPATAIFGLSLLFVFLILAAQYESWSLPFSVLLGTPIAVFGAFGCPLARRDGKRCLLANRIDHADRPGGQECDS